MKTSLLVSIALLNVCMFSSCSNSISHTQKKIAVNSSDIHLIMSAYQCSYFALKIAEEGAIRSASFETKQIAEQSLQSNKLILSQLAQIAGEKGIELPGDLNSEQLKQWKELVKQKGLLFDRSFIEMSDKQSLQTVQIFDYISKRAQDAGIRKTASSLLNFTNSQPNMAQTQASIAPQPAANSLIKTAAFTPQ